MPLVSMRQLLDRAAEGGYGVPAFNVNDLEQVQAVMAAAAETDSPVIMQASAGAREYAGEPFLRHLVVVAVETYPAISVVMHQALASRRRYAPRRFAGVHMGNDGWLPDGRQEIDR